MSLTFGYFGRTLLLCVGAWALWKALRDPWGDAWPIWLGIIFLVASVILFETELEDISKSEK